MNDANVTGGAVPAGNIPSGTILIVDDTEMSVAALELACAAIPGMKVSFVSSALAAVRLLRNGKMPIRAVVTDIRMPAMDGFELIQFIRADSRYGRLPIIVVSADTDPRTPERTLHLGADAYFAKPCSPNAVRQALERLLYGNASTQ